MKLYRVAIVLLLCIAILVTLNAIYITRTVDGFLEQLSALPEPTHVNTLKDTVTTLREEYDRFDMFWSLSINHEDLMDVHMAFSDLDGAAQADDLAAFLQAKSRLTDALWHLRRLSSFNFYSIF